MTTRRLTLILSTAIALFGAFAGPAGAQMLEKLKKTTPEQRAKIQTELMKAKLDLNPAQVGQVGALNLKYAQKMQPLIAGGSGPLMEMREMREINEQKEADLKKILTSDQFEKYLAAKEEMREKFEERIEKKMEGE